MVEWYFYNASNKTSTVHRVTTGSYVTACGLTVGNDMKQVAKEVTCKRCKDTSEYRHGSH